MGGLDMTLLSDSIATNGLLVPITVADDTIVDGYRRFLVFKARGEAEIECHEVEGDPDELRIIAQTRHTEFGRDEKRALVGDLLQRDRQATAATLAHRLQWSPAEVESLAGVDYLIPDFLQRYKAGDITLAEAWQLSRCRDEGQLQLLEPSDESLYDRAAAMHREVRAARRRNMVSRPRGKGYNALIRERDNPTEAGIELIKANAQTPMDGWLACLNWVLSSK